MNFLDKVKAAAETSVDHTKVSAGGGGGDYVPPAEGRVRLRFIGYVELGKHNEEYQGQKKVANRIRLFFECSGPKHAPKVTESGTYPHIIQVDEKLSLHEKANWPKLFAKLNYAKGATHPAHLLGEAYLGTIRHRKWARKNEPKGDVSKWTGIDVTLRSEDGSYTITPPSFEDPETGEMRHVEVAAPLTPIKAFLWDNPDIEQWQSIFIDGEWPERKDKDGNVTAPARSKNVIQHEIMKAINYPGSAINHLLVDNGCAPDLPGVDTPDGDDDDAVLASAAKPAKPAPQVQPATPPARQGAAKPNLLDMDDDIPF